MLATDSLHTIKLPTFTKPQPTLTTKSQSPPANPTDIASQWLTSFASALSSNDLTTSLPAILHADCWWRDTLALSWDLRTIRGLPALQDYLGAQQPRFQLRPTALADSSNFAPSAKTPIEGLEWVESMFSWETSVGRGKGMLRLVQDEAGAWKAYMLYTALQELKGFEEKVGERRPHGGHNSLEGGPGSVKRNWLERRERQAEFLDEEPQVVCVGAGQSGLNLAARLQALGVSCLLIDRNKRVGDNWRSRYRTLVTHDPVQYSHMAYMPFPTTWPLFTPKDKLGDWFEAYATLLEINTWLSSTITSSSYSDATHTWTIDVARGSGETRTIHPRHIVWCTGHSGEPKIPAFPGQSSFAGTVYHGSQHVDASSTGADLSNKKIVVVGTGNSGHDIAQNYYDNGAQSVTMVQRRGTYVISAAEGKGIFTMHKGLYDEFGPPTEDVDLYAQSLPMAVQFALHVPFTQMVREQLEKETLDGLKKAGFEVDFGEAGSGLFRKYITKGGGYYIDVGCSKLICEGKIKVANSPDGIKGFEKDALVLADGRRLEADVVVLATGYDNMRTSVAKALGKEQAERCIDVWDLDQEGEVNAMWRPSGHPGLWFMGGNLALCRIYSKFLALQIKAVEEGLNA
ncbi:Flavin-containing monooxygenase-like protein [Neofusicoccum parvum]|uniref:Flavin-containing monooxygenase-like protein n=1 Tax=Neofusicoccum parvum TaxID=310453 RepID=A0ACB5S505_9PEZI|nr:Flavin-containing monooxygenase-like protein [Neofusicoccum parvum]